MRKTYIDNIRWITVVIVVVYHVIYMFNGVTQFGVIGPLRESQPQDAFLYMVYPWFMLLLFVISGMSARFELDQKNTKQFLKDRTRKLLVPSTIGLLVFGWVMGYYSMLIAGSLEQMSAVPKPVLFLIMCVSGTGPLWFIQLLWVFGVLLLLVRKLEKNRFYKLCEKTNFPILLACAVPIYLSAQILNTPMIVVYRFGIYGFGFFVGYFVLYHDKVMDALEKNWIVAGALAVISGIVFVVMYWGQSYPDHQVLDSVVCNVYAWFGTLGVLAFMKKWGNFENDFSRWMRKKSWGLYIFHYLPIVVTAWYLKSLVPVMAPVLVYLIVAVAAFAGAFALYEVISRIPVVRWCVLGERKQNEFCRKFDRIEKVS